MLLRTRLLLLELLALQEPLLRTLLVRLPLRLPRPLLLPLRPLRLLRLRLPPLLPTLLRWSSSRREPSSCFTAPPPFSSPQTVSSPVFNDTVPSPEVSWAPFWLICFSLPSGCHHSSKALTLEMTLLGSAGL
jgi:hypothetical protein